MPRRSSPAPSGPATSGSRQPAGQQGPGDQHQAWATGPPFGRFATLSAGSQVHPIGMNVPTPGSCGPARITREWQIPRSPMAVRTCDEFPCELQVSALETLWRRRVIALAPGGLAAASQPFRFSTHQVPRTVQAPQNHEPSADRQPAPRRRPQLINPSRERGVHARYSSQGGGPGLRQTRATAKWSRAYSGMPAFETTHS
jgi:hypothetical protein